MWFPIAPNSRMSFFVWIIHRTKNVSILIFHLGMSTPSTLSNMIFDGIFEAHHAQILSCFGPGVGAWFIVWPIFLGWQLVFPIFSTTFWIQLQLPHPSIVSIFQCVCTHPIDPIGIHLLHCVHVNECIKTYDTVCDTFAAIVYDVGSTWGENNYMRFF